MIKASTEGTFDLITGEVCWFSCHFRSVVCCLRAARSCLMWTGPSAHPSSKQESSWPTSASCPKEGTESLGPRTLCLDIAKAGANVCMQRISVLEPSKRLHDSPTGGSWTRLVPQLQSAVHFSYPFPPTPCNFWVSKTTFSHQIPELSLQTKATIHFPSTTSSLCLSFREGPIRMTSFSTQICIISTC